MLYSKWPTVLPAVGGEIRMPYKSDLSYPPTLRFAGAQGGKPQGSLATASPLTDSDAASVRQRESSTPHDPSRRDHRTHAAYAAAELSGCVNSGPIRTRCSHPMLYRTHHPTIPNRDRLSPHIVQYPQSPAISRLSVAGTKGKTDCFIRNRAETAACATGQTMPI